MVEDAISTCVSSGYDPEWLIKLDCENFQGIYSSVKRIEARDRMWLLNTLTVTSHPDKDGKGIKNMFKSLENWLPWAEIKQSLGDAKGLERLFKRGK
tara:strand:- start:616 stop:906 length:291 start_codon:yes stop_codon:yes gene_type:complete